MAENTLNWHGTQFGP